MSITSILLNKKRRPGLLTKVSVPFPKGEITDIKNMVIKSKDGKSLSTQSRVLLRWSDSSIKWALFLFDSQNLKGPFRLDIRDKKESFNENNLVKEEDERVKVNTGIIRFSIPQVLPEDINKKVEGILTNVERYQDGKWNFVTKPRLDAGLVIKDSKGIIYSNQKAGPQFKPNRFPGYSAPDYGVKVIEEGPLRALIRVAGKTSKDNYRGSLDYVIWIEAYRNQSLIKIKISWLHRDEKITHWIKDIRFKLPLAFKGEEITLGFEGGIYREDIQYGREYSILQLDKDQYLARRYDWDNDEIDLAHGSLNGEKAPGWMQIAGQGQKISLYVPHFVEEYPNELTATLDTLTVGLWPERANEYIGTKKILPPLDSANPEFRHRHITYECLCTHPYWAFYSKEHNCLETVKGMQKTQEIFIDFNPNISAEFWQDSTTFETVGLQTALVNSKDVEKAKVLGEIKSCNLEVLPKEEKLLEEAANWFHRHIEYFDIAGKFDFGDLIYLKNSPYMSDYRHTSLKVHPRSGYWNNNEEDPIHGLFLHSLRTGNINHLKLALNMAHHFWDIDVCHYPEWGVYTHAYGHCFRGQSSATDHFWIEGLLDYYLQDGNPDILEGIKGIAQYCIKHMTEIKMATTNLREVSIAIMQAVNYYHFLGEKKLLEKAKNLVNEIIEEQDLDGFYPGYGSQIHEGEGLPHSLFGTLALEALAQVYSIEPDEKIKRSFLKQVDWFLEKGLLPAKDGMELRPSRDGTCPGKGNGYKAGWHSYKLADMQLLKVLSYAYKWTGKEEYIKKGKRILNRLINTQFDESYGEAYQGNWCDEYQIKDGCREHSKPKVLVIPSKNPCWIRPLCPSVALRCLPYFLAVISL